MPALADAPLLSQAEVAELFSFEDFDRAVGRLHFGTAPDSLGWHGETFFALSKEPRLRRSFHALIQADLSGQLGDDCLGLV